MASNAKATQDFVPIKEVRDGIIILKDGGIRAVVMASSINLMLKSYEEQEAIISQFKSFLNSLDFSTQIVVQSRRMDVKPYLELLDQRIEAQEELLMKVQTQEYRTFIEQFTDEVNIMTKNFFIVVPYTAPKLDTKSGIDIFSGLFKSKEKEAEKETAFEEKRSQLDQRISVIQQGLSRVGVRTVQLGTDEIIELFFKSFNPGATGSIQPFEGETTQ